LRNAEGYATLADGIPCPYGSPGDRLWLKETFKIMHTDSLHAYPELQDGRPIQQGNPDEEEFPMRVPIYRATDPDIELSIEDENGDEKVSGWKPSIFMPRWASRITLEVTERRVARVQEISEADAIAEGVEAVSGSYMPAWKLYGQTGGATMIARHSYQTLWNSINLEPKPILKGKKIVGYECYPWSNEDFDAAYPGVRLTGLYRGLPLMAVENPFVWCISFKRIKP